MFAGLAKAALQAVMYAALAAVPMVAPAKMGAAATKEEIGASEAAGLGEGASLVEVGDTAGEIVSQEVISDLTSLTQTGSSETPGSEGGSISEPGSQSGENENGSDRGSNSGHDSETGDEGSTDRPESPNNDGSKGDKRSTEGGPKVEPGVKMPWNTKPSYHRNGKPKTRGWHRLPKGKANLGGSITIPFITQVSQRPLS